MKTELDVAVIVVGACMELAASIDLCVGVFGQPLCTPPGRPQKNSIAMQK